MQSLIHGGHQGTLNLRINMTTPSSYSVETPDSLDLSQPIYKKFSPLDYASQDSFENENLSIGLSSNSKGIVKFSSSRRDKYCVIPNKTRLELIDLVVNKKEKIKKAATKLGVNYSTAKSIFQIYKKEGRLDKKCAKKPHAKRQRAVDDLSESNLTNVSDHADLTPLDKPMASLDNHTRISLENAKVREPTPVSNDCLKNLNQLAVKLQWSEPHSDCPTTNTLNFSRNSSISSDMNQYQYPIKKAEAPTFFATLLRKDCCLAENLNVPKCVCSHSLINECKVDVDRSGYNMCLLQGTMKSLLIQQQQQQGQELIKELVKSKLLTYQLNQLRNLNGLMEMQNQLIHHQGLKGDMFCFL